jgi:hypothetical protein
MHDLIFTIDAVQLCRSPGIHELDSTRTTSGTAGQGNDIKETETWRGGDVRKYVAKLKTIAYAVHRRVCGHPRSAMDQVEHQEQDLAYVLSIMTEYLAPHATNGLTAMLEALNGQATENARKVYAQDVGPKGLEVAWITGKEFTPEEYEKRNDASLRKEWPKWKDYVVYEEQRA